MVSKAHGQGRRAGWYFGNYQCRDAMGKGPWDVNGKPNCTDATHGHACERWDMARVAEGAVAAIKYYGCVCATAVLLYACPPAADPCVRYVHAAPVPFLACCWC